MAYQQHKLSAETWRKRKAVYLRAEELGKYCSQIFGNLWTCLAGMNLEWQLIKVVICHSERGEESAVRFFVASLLRKTICGSYNRHWAVIHNENSIYFPKVPVWVVKPPCESIGYERIHQNASPSGSACFRALQCEPPIITRFGSAIWLDLRKMKNCESTSAQCRL